MLEQIKFDLFKEIEQVLGVIAFKAYEKKLELLVRFDFSMVSSRCSPRFRYLVIDGQTRNLFYP